MITSVAIPPVSKEVIARLRQAFPGPRIDKTFKSTEKEILWDEAQKQVVDWIEHRYLGGRLISGDPADLEKPEQPQPWWRRLFRTIVRKTK